jgi:hypothetical protein
VGNSAAQSLGLCTCDATKCGKSVCPACP